MFLRCCALLPKDITYKMSQNSSAIVFQSHHKEMYSIIKCFYAMVHEGSCTVNAPEHEWALSFMIDTLGNWVNTFIDSGFLLVSE